MRPFKTDDLEVGDCIEVDWPHLEGEWEVTQKGVLMAGVFRQDAVLIKQGDAIKYAVGGLHGRIVHCDPNSQASRGY